MACAHSNPFDVMLAYVGHSPIQLFVHKSATVPGPEFCGASRAVGSAFWNGLRECIEATVGQEAVCLGSLSSSARNAMALGIALTPKRAAMLAPIGAVSCVQISPTRSLPR